MCKNCKTLIEVITVMQYSHKNECCCLSTLHNVHFIKYLQCCLYSLPQPVQKSLGYSNFKYLTQDRVLTNGKYSFMITGPILSDFCSFALPETLHEDTVSGPRYLSQPLHKLETL